MVVPPAVGGNATHGIAPSRPPPRFNAAHSHNLPFSARRAPPLDMSTVERRGQPLAVREPMKRVRPHGLQEAPTFRPTEEEFKDPMEYMRKIAPEGRQYGICRIIPPEGWQPDFAIDTERFHFRTRRQELNSVEGGTRANLNYLDQLAKFHKQHGNNLNRFPSVDKRPLDLYKLKKAVEVRGGFEKVCKLKKWAEIGRDLGYSGKIMSSLSTSLKNSYQRWLHPYEEYLRIAKPGVQQQLELEYGGPITPSPLHSPMKRTHSQQNTPSYQLPPSPAIRATNALQASINSSDMTPERSIPPVEAPRPMSSSGFTAVNANSFSAINAPTSGFVAVNNQSTVPMARQGSNGSSMHHGKDMSPALSAMNTPEYQPSRTSSTPLANGTNGTNGHAPNGLKRALSHDSLNGSHTETGEANGDADGGSGRRSKRLKKEVAPTVAGSHMSLLRPSTPRMRAKNGNRKPGEKCEQCGKTDDRPSIIACDSCDNGYHKYCIDPPLANVPDYDWHCPKCLVGTGEYGFEEGGIYSLRQFQEKANNFKDNYFSPKMPYDPVHNTKKPVSEDVTESEFWRLVESLTETVEVEYGADIHSTTHGSGFPTVENQPLDPYSTDPWNLNVLPLHQDSLFRHIKSDISGMTVPWLYVGMCFSTFCWHNEDHYTYSANYQHFGATKTWYGIPGSDAEAFEEAMRQAVPELFETQPDLLFQLVTLLPPDQLRKAGVNVYALDQRAGQFVVTFPQAYHAGFNHGFNFNEAVNFAPADWEPFGEASVERLKTFRRQPCFSHDELLLTAAGRDTSIKTAKWLAPALERTRDREIQERADFVSRHKDVPGHSCNLDPDFNTTDSSCDLRLETVKEEFSEEEYQCYFCKAYCFLSQFRCHSSGRILCLSHAGSYDCCDKIEQERLNSLNHSIRYRIDDQGLRSLVQKVVDRANAPEAWTARLDKTLEGEARPSLKALQTLLTEGDRIQYPLPGLPDLTDYVQRCNKWVDEATNYITRKQQNRRKNEKAWRKGTAKAAMEERDKDMRRVEKIHQLLADAEDLSFDCPQIVTLQERAHDIEEFQRKATNALKNSNASTMEALQGLLEEGKAFNVDMPQLQQLEEQKDRMEWLRDAYNLRQLQSVLTLEQCDEIIHRASDVGLLEMHPDLLHFKEMKRQGEIWDAKAKELVAAETVHYQQLEALSNQAQKFPVSAETLTKVEAILAKQRQAHREILSLYERSKDPDFRKRPKYKEVHQVIEGISELNSKPVGTIDLEKEQKRHEDWMRKGKKLFGKANAPLHILHAHMRYVENRNQYCFDLNDKPRSPAEPQSRNATPETGLDDSREESIFCICRQPEAGMMIECDICHEWYHGKCLKLARGKAKAYDAYTCPICDWRLKIPRDAARPKLEDLQDWAAEMETLPFQPDEEDTLENIIDQAASFREHLQPYIRNLNMVVGADDVPTMIFWLRKIEGAEILLASETNFFRSALHVITQVADVPPPRIQESLSTRKPRPTKQQKLMVQYGVERPEDLPQHLRTKAHVFKRKDSESHTGRPLPLQPMPMGSTTPQGDGRSASTGNPPSSLQDRNNTIVVQTKADFPRYHGENEMMFGQASTSAPSDPPLFSPRVPGLNSPIRIPPGDSPLFRPLEPEHDVLNDALRALRQPPMAPGYSQLQEPSRLSVPDRLPMFGDEDIGRRDGVEPEGNEDVSMFLNDGDGEPDGVDGEPDAVAGMTSQAMDALEAMDSASSRERDEDGENSEITGGDGLLE